MTERGHMMVRKVRTRVLASSDIKFLKKLTGIIKRNHDFRILEEPSSGLVMIKMRESAQNHLFYLGEVLVTECKVMLKDQIGLGIIKGVQKKKARYMAIIDAAYSANVAEIALLDQMLEHEKEHQDQAKAADVATILKTKVDFETLDEEVKA